MELVQTRYKPFAIEPFSAATVSQLPLVLIGTFTPTGTAVVPTGPKDAYRFCLILREFTHRQGRREESGLRAGRRR